MQRILNSIIDRLSERDVVPLEVPRLIKDLLNILQTDSPYTLKSVNHSLTGLGWKEQVLEEDVFKLLLDLIEIEGVKHRRSYRVQGR